MGKTTKSPISNVTPKDARRVISAIERDAGKDEDWAAELKNTLLASVLTYLTPSQLREVMLETIDPSEPRNYAYYEEKGEAVSAIISSLPKKQFTPPIRHESSREDAMQAPSITSPDSPNHEEKAMLFLVVYHPEGDEPRSALAEAPNEDAAWDAVAERHHLNAGTSPEDEELYLDHTKVLDSMLKEAQVPYTLTSTR